MARLYSTEDEEWEQQLLEERKKKSEKEDPAIKAKRNEQQKIRSNLESIVQRVCAALRVRLSPPPPPSFPRPYFFSRWLLRAKQVVESVSLGTIWLRSSKRDSKIASPLFTQKMIDILFRLAANPLNTVDIHVSDTLAALAEACLDAPINRNPVLVAGTFKLVSQIVRRIESQHQTSDTSPDAKSKAQAAIRSKTFQELKSSYVVEKCLATLDKQCTTPFSSQGVALVLPVLSPILLSVPFDSWEPPSAALCALSLLHKHSVPDLASSNQNNYVRYNCAEIVSLLFDSLLTLPGFWDQTSNSILKLAPALTKNEIQPVLGLSPSLLPSFPPSLLPSPSPLALLRSLTLRRSRGARFALAFGGRAGGGPAVPRARLAGASVREHVRGSLADCVERRRRECAARCGRAVEQARHEIRRELPGLAAADSQARQ